MLVCLLLLSLFNFFLRFNKKNLLVRNTVSYYRVARWRTQHRVHLVVMQTVDELFSDAGIEYWLSAGTLMGVSKAARDST